VDGNWDWPAGSAQAKRPLGGSARLLAEVACVHVFSIFIYFSLFFVCSIHDSESRK
jgi:hypothetical protein